jgi:hypothetical protein
MRSIAVVLVCLIALIAGINAMCDSELTEYTDCVDTEVEVNLNKQFHYKRLIADLKSGWRL